ncbi:DUF2157 domain-containing protein [Chitinophaga sancti]|uniref:DUF2157 domain-containing protein n=1 Tax=Chitinophaga sancti TaxID=1004 RepID=A0A1K1S6R3_9BACT|nr:DUF2157 domain-containing protein [Chitinophaga sancti]WQD62186.1 DUF2157 domain-containing protein [Chitinophaga sancti]WQG92245.1 DUF2157 domain-containing protein [Chitinophaga sancti]SFW80014.1 Predicted membrane protein [Chitinophaga sancti]
MNIRMFGKLEQDGLISPGSMSNIHAATGKKLFSLHWELKTILYLGVLLLSGGLGVLVYKNIDTIGHQVILLAIALACAGCFYYCFRQKLPFSWGKVEAPNPFFDYVLLLGCLLLITFITYLQAVYGVFKWHYGTATFIPLIVLFFSAYYFDHLGVLSLAITNLAAWLGVNVSPLTFLEGSMFITMHLIITGLLLGGALLLVDYLTHYLRKKPHFGFTYRNFGMHLLLLACVTAMFKSSDGYRMEDNASYLIWFALQAGISYYLYREALKHHSFYFLLMIALYAYVGLSYVVVRLLILTENEGGIYAGILYFIASAIGLIIFLVNANKKIKHDSL